MTTENLKDEALEIIGRLFGDCDADEQQQIEALEEIESLCRDNAEMLKEQIKSRAQ